MITRIENAVEFIEVLRIINCMSYQEFVNLFGKGTGGHICSKRGNGNGIKFLFELDTNVLNTIYDYAIKKRKDFLNKGENQ